MFRLGLALSALDPAKRVVDFAEVLLDRFNHRGIAAFAGALQVILRDAMHHRLGGDFAVFRRQVAAIFFLNRTPRISRFVQVKLHERAMRAQRHVVKLAPQPVKLPLARFVEDQLIQRLIITKVTHEVVETGAQVAAAVF